MIDGRRNANPAAFFLRVRGTLRRSRMVAFHRVAKVMSSEGKVAVVTGGGTGIGKAAALALAGDGWRVAITGRRLAPLQAAASEAGANSKNILPVQGDVTDAKSVHIVFTKVFEVFGRVDLRSEERRVGK